MFMHMEPWLSNLNPAHVKKGKHFFSFNPSWHKLTIYSYVIYSFHLFESIQQVFNINLWKKDKAISTWKTCEKLEMSEQKFD